MEGKVKKSMQPLERDPFDPVRRTEISGTVDAVVIGVAILIGSPLLVGIASLVDGASDYYGESAMVGYAFASLVHCRRQIFGLTIGILCTPARHCLKQVMRASCFSCNTAGTQKTIAHAGSRPSRAIRFLHSGQYPGTARKLQKAPSIESCLRSDAKI